MVDLEGIVPAILTGPDLEVLGVQGSHDVGRFIHPIECRGADTGIGVGEGTLAETAQVDLRRDARHEQPVCTQGIAHFVEAHPGREGIGDIDGRELADFGGTLDHL